MSRPHLSQRATVKAFTLVELMIVVVIIGITSAVILVGLANQRINRELEQSARQVMASLREVQNYALTGKTQSAGQIVCYYGIYQGTAGSGQYDYYYSLRDVATDTCQAPTSFLSQSLFNGVALSTNYSSGRLNAFFKLPRAETYLWSSPNWPSFGSTGLITLTKGGQSHALCLYASGRVEDIGTGSSCP